MSSDDFPQPSAPTLTVQLAAGAAADRPALHLPTALLGLVHATAQNLAADQVDARLQAVLDSLGVGYFRCRSDGQLLEGSAALRRMLGIGEADDITQHNLYGFCVRQEPVLGGMRPASDQVHAQQIQLRRTDGAVIWVELTETLFAPVTDGPLVQGLMEEITERKHREEVLWLGEEYFRTLTETAGDVTVVVDAQGTIRYCSTAVHAALDLRAEDLVGTGVFELVHPGDETGARRIVSAGVGTAGTPHTAEIRLRHASGRWRTFEVVVQNLLEDPVVSGVLIRARDITERRRRERYAREAVKHRAALLASNTGIWELNVRSGRVRGSEGMSQLLGHPSQPYRSTYGELLKCVYPADVDRVTQTVVQAVDERKDLYLDFRILRSDGAVRWLSLKGRAFSSGRGGSVRLAGTVVDETERKQAQDKLLHDAFHDALTGLANRALFLDRLTHTVAVAKRQPGYQFGVLVVDLDHFKQINDTLGHLVGDRLLVAVAKRLESCLRPGDTVTRWGGDEFTVLLGNLGDARGATRVAERILREMRVPFSIDGHQLHMTVSIGIAFSSTGYGQPEDLLRNADTALYRAKMRGRDRYEAFDREMHRRAVALLQLESDLRRALERGELRVVYQPIISLSTGTIGGFEALLRWQHAQRGTLAPGEFITVAEDAGLMLEMDRWVLSQACRQITEWSARYPSSALQVSVNLSSKDFTHPELVNRIRSALEETGLDGPNLRLELRENVFAENREAASAVLRQLKELNVGLQIDNFGTGTSAVTTLHDYPIDAFKIDRSLVGRLGRDRQASGIVRALIELAHNLEMKVIAEGTETPEQLRMLRELGCDYAQGFLFAEPGDSKAVEALLTDAPSW
jgi:diguanylate cyclase (GGDEF)-like protein/PAS domain S-box-containing protein